MKTYKISEIAKLLGITIYTLHYYDKEGLLPFVERDKNGNRIFKEDDLHYLYVIDFFKKTEMPLKKIKKYMDLYRTGDTTLSERKEIITTHKKEIRFKIQELTNILEAMDYKEWYYETAIKSGTSKIFDNLKKEDIPKKIHEKIQKIKHSKCISEFIKNK